MIHLRPRHRRRQKRKKKTLNHRNKVKKNELVFERNDQSFWVACGSIFALLVRLQSFWQQCIEHTMPQEKKKKTACPVFFTVQVAFPFLCKILSLYLCVCLNGGRKVWEKEAEKVRNRNLVRASECWRQKRSARPGTALCYTQDPAPSFHSGNKHSSLSLSKKDFVFFFSSRFFSSLNSWRR